MWIFRTSRLTLAASLAAVTLFAAAVPNPDSTVDDMIRAGNEAYLRGDTTMADQLYRQAEQRTADPGLVAFNRAGLFFQAGNYREAELFYVRVLDDQAAPSKRRARAWYNRGVCLIHRGGVSEYRSAIESFERCLAIVTKSDDSLVTDAQHNLELAKLLWNQSRANDKEVPPPNTPPKDSPPESPPKPKAGDNEPTEPGDNPDAAKTKTKPDTQPVKAKPGQTPTPTGQKAVGKGNMAVLLDSVEKMDLSQEDARDYLRRIAERLEKDRRNSAAPGPERPNVLDW